MISKMLPRLITQKQLLPISTNTAPNVACSGNIFMITFLQI